MATNCLFYPRTHHLINFIVLLLFTIAAHFPIKSFAQSISPGKIWKDTDGNIINAHGAGILYKSGTYYWYGEVKREGDDGALALDGVNCYSSKNLTDWKYEGLALRVSQDTNSLLQAGCVIERPKVIYNTKSKKYVMWFHHELKGKGYKAAMTGLATADMPNGPFTYIKSLRPHKGIWPANLPVEDRIIPKEQIQNFRKLPNWQAQVENGVLVGRDFESGQMSRDMTLFVDDDGTAFHIASAEDNQTLHVSKLTEDYLDFSEEYYRILPGQSNEAPAIIKHQGKYYMIASGTTGWDPNPGRSFVADKITGPWLNLGNPVIGSAKDASTTFHSQSTYILKVKKNKYIYLGDRWNSKNLGDSRYVWLPLVFENNRPTLKWSDEWLIK